MDTAAAKPEKVRAFIAIHPDPTTLANLQKMQTQLRSSIKEGVRWAKPEQLHITLQFLGYIQATAIDPFIGAMRQVADSHPQFELRSDGLGCFPNSRRPRVIWAGLHGQVESLQRLKAGLDGSLRNLGYAPETRPFHPHITLGRVTELTRRDNTALNETLATAGQTTFGSWEVQSIDLMRSVLAPKGPTYSTLAAVPLRIA